MKLSFNQILNSRGGIMSPSKDVAIKCTAQLKIEDSHLKCKTTNV